MNFLALPKISLSICDSISIPNQELIFLVKNLPLITERTEKTKRLQLHDLKRRTDNCWAVEKKKSPGLELMLVFSSKLILILLTPHDSVLSSSSVLRKAYWNYPKWPQSSTHASYHH